MANRVILNLIRLGTKYIFFSADQVLISPACSPLARRSLNHHFCRPQKRNLSFFASADALMSGIDFHSDDHFESLASPSFFPAQNASLEDILDRHEAIFGTNPSTCRCSITHSASDRAFRDFLGMHREFSKPSRDISIRSPR